MTITFAIVGTGWRSRFFVRIAATVPDRMRVCGVVTRTSSRAEQVNSDWGVAVPVDPTTPIASELSRRRTGVDLNLEGLDLKHISFDGAVVYRNPFVGSGMSDDDIAVAAIVEATGA